jgi:hypothetical protein
MIDGTTEIKDLEKTEANKALVKTCRGCFASKWKNR